MVQDAAAGQGPGGEAGGGKQVHGEGGSLLWWCHLGRQCSRAGAGRRTRLCLACCCLSSDARYRALARAAATQNHLTQPCIVRPVTTVIGAAAQPCPRSLSSPSRLVAARRYTSALSQRAAAPWAAMPPLPRTAAMA